MALDCGQREGRDQAQRQRSTNRGLGQRVVPSATPRGRRREGSSRKGGSGAWNGKSAEVL